MVFVALVFCSVFAFLDGAWVFSCWVDIFDALVFEGVVFFLVLVFAVGGVPPS